MTLEISGGKLIPEDKIHEVRGAVNIVEIIGRDIPLARAGQGRYKALCPFHAEKTPSFFVDENRQTFKCFGCGKGGNVFTFLMERENLTFPEAVETMANEAGIDLPRTGRGNEGGPRVRDLYGVMELAADFFHRLLFEDNAGKGALDYVKRRNISVETARAFKLGFAPDRWDALLGFMRGKKVSTDVLEKTGLVRRRGEGEGFYDYFRGRLMFPIRDSRGRTIGFGARTLGNDEPKYLNSPETALFQKSRQLYGLDMARDAVMKSGRAIICEGYTDVMKCHEAGFTTAVATLGTAFGAAHVGLLKRFADAVTVLFDADAAGQRAAARSLDLLAGADVDVKIVTLPGGKDPCEFLVEDGAEAFEKELSGGRDVFEFKLSRVSAEVGADAPRKNERVADGMLELAVHISDPVRESEFMGRLERELGVPRHLLGEKLRRMKKRATGTRVDKIPQAGAIVEKKDRTEWALMELIFAETEATKRAELTSRAFALLQPGDFIDCALGALMEAMALMVEEKGTLDIADLLSTVQGKAAQGATEALLAVSKKPGEDTEKVMSDITTKIKLRELDRKIEKIKKACEAAKREGDMARFNELSLEHQKLIAVIRYQPLPSNIKGVRGGLR